MGCSLGNVYKGSAISVIHSHGALALVESHYGRHKTIPVTWCGQNPTYSAQVGVFDLRNDPTDFMNLTVEDLITAMRAPKSPFRIVQTNSNPTMQPLDQRTVGAIKDCPSNALIASRAQMIARNRSFQAKVGDAIAGRYPEKVPSQFVEERNYDGFPTAGDVRLAAMFHQCPWEERRAILDKMTDDRLRELGFRLFGIEAHDHLSLEEQAFFAAWQQSRRHGPVKKQSFRTVDQAISECREDLESASAVKKSELRKILSWLETQSGEPRETFEECQRVQVSSTR
jgi:exodeoxyribonuclease-1